MKQLVLLTIAAVSPQALSVQLKPEDQLDCIDGALNDIRVCVHDMDRVNQRFVNRKPNDPLSCCGYMIAPECVREVPSLWPGGHRSHGPRCGQLVSIGALDILHVLVLRNCTRDPL